MRHEFYRDLHGEQPTLGLKRIPGNGDRSCTRKRLQCVPLRKCTGQRRAIRAGTAQNQRSRQGSRLKPGASPDQEHSMLEYHGKLRAKLGPAFPRLTVQDVRLHMLVTSFTIMVSLLSTCLEITGRPIIWVLNNKQLPQKRRPNMFQMLSVRHTSHLLLPARTLLKVPQRVHNPTLSESKLSVTVPRCAIVPASL